MGIAVIKSGQSIYSRLPDSLPNNFAGRSDKKKLPRESPLGKFALRTNSFGMSLRNVADEYINRRKRVLAI